MPTFYPMPPSHQSQNVGVGGVPHVGSANGLIPQHTAPLVPSSGYYQQARPGNVVAPLIAGGNGAGKSTLSRLLEPANAPRSSTRYCTVVAG